MSDQKLRDIERRWKETGTVEDEAAYLLERVRVGDLSRERLELAAYCGHEGATRVSGASPAKSGGRDPAAVMAWGIGLKRWGRIACATAAYAVTRYAVALGGEPGEPVVAVMDAVRAWLQDPSEADPLEVRRAAACAWPRNIDHVPLVACWAAECITGNEPDACLAQAMEYAVSFSGKGGRDRDAHGVVEAASEALVDWALGDSH